MKDYKRIEHMRNLNDSLIWERMKRCYDFGYEDGKRSTIAESKNITYKDIDDAYNIGLNTAWELVKRIESTPEDGGLTNQQIEDVFGQYWSSYELYKSFSVDEAMGLMKRYEDKQKQDTEIKVGDEIRLHDAIEVVTSVMSTGLQTIDASGNTSTWYYNTYPLETWEKTGRHFPQIAEVLKEMRGAENDT